MRRLTYIAGILALAICLTLAQPASATHDIGVSSNTTASDLSAGSTTNAEVERDDEAGYVGHDTYRSSATVRWAFDEGSGSTAYDHIGSNDGSLSSGATWESGIHGQAVNVTGGDQVAMSSAPVTGSTNRTVSIWFKDTGGSAEEIIKWGSGGTTGENWVVRLRDGPLIGAAVYNGYRRWDAPSNVEDGSWHHLAIVLRGSNTVDLEAYLDGERLTVNDTASASISTANSAGRIGRNMDAVDDTRVYSSALSAGQIRRLAETPNAKLSARATERWAVDANQGPTVYGDEGNDGTNNGATWDTSPVSGSALRFNSTEKDYVAAPHDASLNPGTQSFALSTWFTRTGSDIAFLSGKYNASGYASEGYSLRLAGGTDITASVEDGDGNRTNVRGPRVSANEAHHAVMVWDAPEKTLYLYLDGTEVANETAPDTDGINPTEAFELGRQPSSDNHYLDGLIDEARLYTGETLSSSEVSALYNRSSGQLQETSSYQGSHAATNTVEGWTDLKLHNATATVTWEGSSDGGSSWTTLASSTYSTSGNKSLSWSEYSGDDVRVTVDVETSHPDHTARLHDEGVLAQTYTPSVDNASLSPNTTAETQASPVTLEADVSDPDFATTQGEELTLEWYVDGQLDGTTTVTSNGTATYQTNEAAAGDHTWHVEVADSDGHQVSSATAEFTLPGTLYVRDESNPKQLVDNASVEIRFYFEDGGTLIENRTSSDGTVNMSGLPTDRPFVVVAETDGYYPRRIYKESLTNSQNIYLLNESKQAVEPTFELVDYSGAFPEEDTVMLIQRALTNDSDVTQWRTVQGDRFGATGQFPAQLRYNQRHRLILINTETGKRLNKKQYTPTSSDLQEVRVLSTEDIELQNVETIASIGPDVRSLVGRNGTVFTATIDAGDSTVDSWTVTATYSDGNTTTTLYEDSGSGSVELRPALNLSGRGGGKVTVTVQYTLDTGTTGTKNATFVVRASYQNEYSLLSVLGSVTTLLPGQHVDQATSMLALIFTLLLTAAAASVVRPSTEGVGLIAVGFVSAFYTIGWLSRETMFIAAVAWLAIAGLRRGL